MVTNTINIRIQWRRFLPDAGVKDGLLDSPECSGSNIGSDIFDSLRFFLASHKNVEIRLTLSSDFETTSIGLIFLCP
jgi:hypothetical protein